MKRYLVLGYGAAAYEMFLVAFQYAIGFMGDIVVPRSVDHGLTAPVGRALLVDTLLLALLYWRWRTMPAVVWDVRPQAGRLVLWALFGLRQVYLAWRAEPHTELGFQARSLYRLVRHPIMLGFVIAFWLTPTMTAGRLLLAGPPQVAS